MDREKVIHAVETAFELWIDEYTGCSWFKEDEVRQAKEDALAMLKEQDAVVKQWTKEIADNQLAHAPKDSHEFMSLNEHLEKE